MPSELVWNGKQVKAAFKQKVNIALTKSAIVVQGRAVALVPVDTGLLRSSIEYQVRDKGLLSRITGGFLLANAQEAIIGTVVFYGVYVELGNRFTEAQAFLLPAYRNSFDDIRRFFETELGSIEWLN